MKNGVRINIIYVIIYILYVILYVILYTYVIKIPIYEQLYPLSFHIYGIDRCFQHLAGYNIFDMVK